MIKDIRAYNRYSVNKYDILKPRFYDRLFIINGIPYEEISFTRDSQELFTQKLWGFKSLDRILDKLPSKIFDDEERNKTKKFCENRHFLSYHKVIKVLPINKYLLLRKITNPHLYYLTSMDKISITYDDIQLYYVNFNLYNYSGFVDITEEAKRLKHIEDVESSQHKKYYINHNEAPLPVADNRSKFFFIPKFIKPTKRSSYKRKYYYEYAGQWRETNNHRRYTGKREVAVVMERPKTKQIYVAYIPKSIDEYGCDIYGYANNYYSNPKDVQHKMNKVLMLYNNQLF